MSDSWLLTPGPLTTSVETRNAMQRDWGSRNDDFIRMTARIRSRLLRISGDDGSRYECVPMQGSGTFSVESMLGTMIPREGKTLVLVNGAYGRRAASILDRIGRDYSTIDKGDCMPPRGPEVARVLESDPAISHVFAVHCETTSGILNPIEEIADATHGAGRKLLVDAMSSFGAIPFDIEAIAPEAVAASSNKNLEGVPGIGFVIARRDALESAAGNCHSISLDAHAQWIGLEGNGQWRFTPPTHVVAALDAALEAHEEEGGVEGRNGRYVRNRDTLVDGMRKMGFHTLLEDEWMSPIIVTFLVPADPAFSFAELYRRLKNDGFVIYPGKLTTADTIRIGCIGAFPDHVMSEAVESVRNALEAMGVRNCRPSPREASLGGAVS